MKRNM